MVGRNNKFKTKYDFPRSRYGTDVSGCIRTSSNYSNIQKVHVAKKNKFMDKLFLVFEIWLRNISFIMGATLIFLDALN